MIPDDYITLPFPPMSKNAQGNKIPVARGRIVLSKEYRNWKARTAEWLWALKLPKLHGQVRLDYILVVPDLKARDLVDNAISGLLDAACGILYNDDSQIWEGHQYKRLDRTVQVAQLHFRFTQLGPEQQLLLCE